MAEDAAPPHKRVKLTKDDLDRLSKEEMMDRWIEQEAYIEALMSRQGGPSAEELAALRESEEKLKQQQVEATRRENVLVMRLSAKEQEMQECLNQIQELKSVQNASMAQLRATLLDPAVNVMFQRMRKETDAHKEKLEQAQNDLTAWKFTPDSQTGKRLMAKCSLLLQENEELGKVVSSGRTAKLQGEIALHKKFVEEMKKSQAETDEFLVEMDEDVEGMQSTIYYLQQQLKETKAELASLQAEHERLRVETPPQGNGPTQHTHTPVTSSPMDTQSDVNVRTTDTGNDAGCSSPTDSSPKLNRTDRTDELCSSVSSTSDSATHHHGNPHQPAQTTNGDHVAMETDTFDGDDGHGQQEQEAEQQQQGCDVTPTTDRTDASYPEKQTPGAVHNNAGGNHPHRTSLSSTGTDVGTDVSNDTWSPIQLKQTAGSLSDEDVDTDNRLVSSEEPRTEIKGEALLHSGGDSLQNGLILARQYDSEGAENDT